MSLTDRSCTSSTEVDDVRDCNSSGRVSRMVDEALTERCPPTGSRDIREFFQKVPPPVSLPELIHPESGAPPFGLKRPPEEDLENVKAGCQQLSSSSSSDRGSSSPPPPPPPRKVQVAIPRSPLAEKHLNGGRRGGSGILPHGGVLPHSGVDGQPPWRSLSLSSSSSSLTSFDPAKGAVAPAAAPCEPSKGSTLRWCQVRLERLDPAKVARSTGLRVDMTLPPSRAPPDLPVFEVERIMDFSWCKFKGEGLYLVKWEDWPSEFNTWEPLRNLVDCQDKLKEFYYHRLTERENAAPNRKRFFEVPPDPRPNFERRSDYADRICPPPCMSEVEAFFKALKDNPVIEWGQARLNSQLEKLSAMKKRPNQAKVDKVRRQIMLRHCKERRREQLRRLKEWETEVNSLSSENAKIAVENDHDLEGPPRHMTYINSYKPAAGITIPDDPPIGCECPDGGACSSRTQKSCCSGLNGHQFAYNFQGKLRVKVGAPIYECNKRCKCSRTCKNRVVQKGRKVKLCIFRTSNGCGWGVKTLENIKEGTFVVEYVGEVITSEEAEERGQKYDAEGRTYLFDLDFNLGDQNPYTVDAALYGNVSHFINHSCEPNLEIFNVWIDCLDPNLPRLCLFAARDIFKGEQLTFDYKQRTDAFVEDGDGVPDGGHLRSKDDGSGPTSVGKTECRCGSLKCRKTLF